MKKEELGGGEKLSSAGRLMNGSRRVIYSASRILVDRRAAATPGQNLKRLFIKSERTPPLATGRTRMNAGLNVQRASACTRYIRRADPVNSGAVPGATKGGEEKKRRKQRKKK